MSDKRGSKLMALAKRAGLDWFLLALLCMIGLAYILPGPGIYKGSFSLSQFANLGVSVIFFFYGLKLSPEKMKAGMRNWRLHLVVQLSTFLLFPMLIVPFYEMYKGQENELLWLGTFYLAALPSTVSSSVVMVSIAGGNIPAAIFNASISSLMGIFITPLWMGLFLTTAPGEFDLWQVMGKLIIQVLLPVVLGVVLHSRWGNFAEKYKQQLRLFDQSIILLIVYTSFCESFAKNMFSAFSFKDLLLLGATMLGIFFLVYGVLNFLSRIFGFNHQDRITALFCGSKKSLVHGTVMSKVLFQNADTVGIILLPIMIYHALQLLVASIIAQSLARRNNN